MSGPSVTRVVVIAWTNLLRQVRGRGSLFFVFVLPTIIIVALGLQFGGSGHARLGIVAPAGDAAGDAVGDAAGDAAAEALVTQLREGTGGSGGFDVRPYTDEAALRSAVERGNLEAGLILPEGYAASLAGSAPVEITFLGTPETVTTGYRATIGAAVAEQAMPVAAARTAVALGAGTYDQAYAVAVARRPDVTGIEVTVSVVGKASVFRNYGRFTFGAQTQLLLFMFLTSMTAAGQLVQSRRLGVSRRMVSTPTSIATIVAGEALGRYLIALMQGLFVVALTAIVFGVSWGDPVAAAAIILAFALVAAGVAMLIGAVSTNADQASSLGVFAGLALGALGGCMIPLAYMPEAMRTIAGVIPHSWAITAFQALISDGGGIDTVAPNVVVLLGYGVVVLGLATWRFRKAITG